MTPDSSATPASGSATAPAASPRPAPDPASPSKAESASTSAFATASAAGSDAESGRVLFEAVVPVAGHELALLIDAASGAAIAAGFCPVADLVARLEPGELGTLLPTPDDHPVLVALRDYADGQVDALDDVAVAQPASPFRGEVQAALRRIPAGETRTYTELAADAGRPSAVRAAASGCATNRVAPIVPCHRVLRTDGSLGGYAYGLDVKAALLRHEGAQTARPVG